MIKIIFCQIIAFVGYHRVDDNRSASYKLDFHTFYNQFYISSDNCSFLNNVTDNYTDNSFIERLIVAKNALVVLTGSIGHIKGELKVLDKPSVEKDFSKYDHVVEGGLEVNTGLLKIFDCPSSLVEFEVKVKPGIYRIRIYSSNLTTTDIDEVEGNDYYKIEIWPDTYLNKKILKQYPALKSKGIK